jgi:hypothetical protein
VRRVEVSGVHLLAQDDAGITPQLRVDLSAPDVDRVDAGGAPLQQTIGESSRGRAHVDAHASGRIDSEVVERGRELDPASRDVGVGRARHADLRVLGHGCARLVRAASGHLDPSRENHRLGPLARRREPARDEKEDRGVTSRGNCEW